jgi:hypothetical protein
LTGQRRSVRAGLSAQACQLQFFFSRAQASGAQNLFFFLTGRIHSAAGRADFFFELSGHSRASSVRAPCRIFFCPVTATLKCQGAQFFWLARSHPVSCRARRNFLLACPVAVHSTVSACEAFSFGSPPRRNVCPCCKKFLLLSGRIVAAQQIIIFLVVRSHPRSSLLVQNFFSRAAFSFAIRSHLRRTFLIFFVAHGISAVHLFRILRQKFELFGVFPLPFLAL